MDLADIISFGMEAQGLSLATLLPEREREQAEEGIRLSAELISEEAALAEEEVERLQQGEGGEYDLAAALGVTSPYLSNAELEMLLQDDEVQDDKQQGSEPGGAGNQGVDDATEAEQDSEQL